MKKANEIILTDMMDCAVMPQMVDRVLEEYSKEQERFICKTLTELNIDKNILANQVREIQRLNNLLQEYKDLEEQGLLLRLPCKVGDTLYIIEPRFYNYEMHEGVQIGVCKSYEMSDRYGWVVKVKLEKGEKHSLYYYNFSKFGKTVFLIREEAEQKLKEMEE
jgi:hypothetical protein